MGNSDDTFEKWRRNASRQHNDLTDRYTVLWEELVRAWQACDRVGQAASHPSGHRPYFDGLLHAYILLTGEPQAEIQRMVAAAAREPVLS